jgi:hypothetical protein
MKRYRPQVGLAIVMAAVFALVSLWQAPGRTPSRADVDDYIIATLSLMPATLVASARAQSQTTPTVGAQAPVVTGV